MSLGSTPRDNFIQQLEALQKTLDNLLTQNKSSLSSQSSNSEEDIFNLSSEIFFKMDIHGVIRGVNNATRQALSYPNDELLGLHFVDIVAYESKKSCREFINKLSSGFPSVSFKVTLTKKQGTQTSFICKALKKNDYIYALSIPQSNEIQEKDDFLS